MVRWCHLLAFHFLEQQQQQSIGDDATIEKDERILIAKIHLALHKKETDVVFRLCRENTFTHGAQLIKVIKPFVNFCWLSFFVN